MSQWSERVNEAIRRHGVRRFTRVLVVAETKSTQDLARADGKSGLIVVADRQTSGRGRLGRTWHDPAGLGLAVTFTLDASDVEPAALSIAGGLAALEACTRVIGERSTLGVRWPNDVVERTSPGRKLAGVLIERDAVLATVGIGVNVLQRDEDFPEPIRGRAASVSMLGSRASRADVLVELVLAFDDVLSRGGDRNAEQWQASDVLIGTKRTFEHAGRRYAGVVQMVRPTSHIQIRGSDGVITTLPALTTSMVHDP